MQGRVGLTQEGAGLHGESILDQAWLIAEGIETIAELDRLLSLRVPLVRGYGLVPPWPVMAAARPDAVAVPAA